MKNHSNRIKYIITVFAAFSFSVMLPACSESPGEKYYSKNGEGYYIQLESNGHMLTNLPLENIVTKPWKWKRNNSNLIVNDRDIGMYFYNEEIHFKPHVFIKEN